MSQWYAVRTATRRERAAKAGLEERGFTTFLPMRTYWSALFRGLREARHAPLIPGYLFVLCEEADFAAIHDAEAVHAFVMATVSEEVSRPIVFPLAVILGLQCEEAAGLYDSTRLVKVTYRPKKGDRVRVRAGPWFNFVGKVLATPRGARVHVMIEGPFGRGEHLDVGHVCPA